MSRQPTRAVVLVSGNGSNLQALLDATRSPAFPAVIAGVISDNPQAHGLERASQAGVPARAVPRKDFATRHEFEQALAGAIDALGADVILLAGFMRILRGDLPARFAGRMLNIHPSLLPRHKGLDTHARCLAAGDPEHGCSVHFVTAELDAGPTIIQAHLPVDPDDTPERLAERVLPLEHGIYPIALRWLAEGRLHWADGHVTLDGQPLTEPVRVSARSLAA